MASTWPWSSTSHGTTSDCPPAETILADTLSRSLIVRALTATFAPRCASTSAVAAPIPRDAPVTSATRFLSVMRLFLWCVEWTAQDNLPPATRPYLTILFGSQVMISGNATKMSSANTMRRM